MRVFFFSHSNSWWDGVEKSLVVSNSCLSQNFLLFFLFSSKNSSGVACIIATPPAMFVIQAFLCMLSANLIPALGKVSIWLLLNCTTSLPAQLFLSYAVGILGSLFSTAVSWTSSPEARSGLQWSISIGILVLCLLFMSHYSCSCFHIRLLFFLLDKHILCFLPPFHLCSFPLSFADKLRLCPGLVGCLTLNMPAASISALYPNSIQCKWQHQGSWPRTPEQTLSLQKLSWNC